MQKRWACEGGLTQKACGRGQLSVPLASRHHRQVEVDVGNRLSISGPAPEGGERLLEYKAQDLNVRLAAQSYPAPESR